MLHVHLISLADQPCILRFFTVPTSLCISQKHALSQLGSLGRMRLLPSKLSCCNNGMRSGGGSTSFTGFILLFPHILWVKDHESHLQYCFPSSSTTSAINLTAGIYHSHSMMVEKLICFMLYFIFIF